VLRILCGLGGESHFGRSGYERRAHGNSVRLAANIQELGDHRNLILEPAGIQNKGTQVRGYKNKQMWLRLNLEPHTRGSLR
jgi:hypothetical protein